MDATDSITQILQEGIQTGVFPGAVLFVRHQGLIRFHRAVGLTSSHPDSSPVQLHTVYDLASLTKPLATASSLLLLVQEERLSLTQQLGTILPEAKDVALGSVSLKDLLCHRSGLPAWRPFYEAFSPELSEESEARQQRMRAVLDMIVKEPLADSPSSTSVYSDLGYILLGCVIERVTGQVLQDFCEQRIFEPLQASPLSFGASCLKDFQSDHIAPTEQDAWRGRLLQGEVHDENAAALGGIAGHAGLFGTAEAVGQITKAWLDGSFGRPSIFKQDVVQQFTTAQPGTSWALGWDTPSQPSSSGQWFSPESFGHLGFTGTSIWIDPVRELEVIFLSNRVHPTRENPAIKTFRPKLHDVIIQKCSGYS